MKSARRYGEAAESAKLRSRASKRKERRSLFGRANLEAGQERRWPLAKAHGGACNLVLAVVRHLVGAHDPHALGTQRDLLHAKDIGSSAGVRSRRHTQVDRCRS